MNNFNLWLLFWAKCNFKSNLLRFSTCGSKISQLFTVHDIIKILPLSIVSVAFEDNEDVRELFKLCNLSLNDSSFNLYFEGEK